MIEVNWTLRVFQLGFEHGFASQSGKIFIFWSAPFSIELIRDLGQALHCWVRHSFLPDFIIVSFVYASCSMHNRSDLWADLVHFTESVSGPWMVGGDFNVVQVRLEITSGSQPQAAIDDFNSAILDCGLEDAGYVGSSFTWTNGRTRRRLDRVVCNAQWLELFSVF